MSVTLAQIEDAIIAALGAKMNYLKDIATYDGEVEGLDEETVLQFVKRFPAALVYIGKIDYTQRAWPLMWQHPKIVVFVCDQNLRGNADARRGDVSSPGTYQMLQDVFDTLFQQNLGLEIDPIDVVTEEAVLNTLNLSVYAAVYSTKAQKN